MQPNLISLNNKPTEWLLYFDSVTSRNDEAVEHYIAIVYLEKPLRTDWTTANISVENAVEETDNYAVRANHYVVYYVL